MLAIFDSIFEIFMLIVTEFIWIRCTRFGEHFLPMKIIDVMSEPDGFK